MSPRRLLAREDGVAMVLVLFAATLLTLLGVTLIELVRDESDRSSQQLRRGAALQAAEAGVDDYASKLVDDRLYYVHQVHAGESTRRDSGGATVAGGTAWTYGLSWTYPSGKDRWRTLPNGYEYNLQVVPPSAGSLVVRIIATGRKTGSASPADTRVIETFIRPSSLADFYRVVNGDVSWGAGATTNGKIYANGNITHDGVATANIYAESQISGGVSMQSGAQRYDVDSNPNIRSQIKNPINFASFLTSFVDVERAAQLAGIHRNDATKAAWKFTFLANGTVDVQACLQTGGNHVAAVEPTCGAATNLAVPANGAIYSAQTAIVSGVVDGRVTVASNDNIVVAGDISYEAIGDDVLGLVAKNNVYVAWYVPDPMTWMASVLAQTGTWQSYPNYSTSPQYAAAGNQKKSLMTFTGSSATDDGGAFSGMFTNRNYAYEPALQYLPPPWFPTVEEAYTVQFFRELPPS